MYNDRSKWPRHMLEKHDRVLSSNCLQLMPGWLGNGPYKSLTLAWCNRLLSPPGADAWRIARTNQHSKTWGLRRLACGRLTFLASRPKVFKWRVGYPCRGLETEIVFASAKWKKNKWNVAHALLKYISPMVWIALVNCRIVVRPWPEHCKSGSCAPMTLSGDCMWLAAGCILLTVIIVQLIQILPQLCCDNLVCSWISKVGS